MVPSTLLSWQFLGPAVVWGCSRARIGSSSWLLWEESDWSQIKPREEGSRKTALPPVRLHKPHSALCFQEAKVLERKDKSICKLLILVPLGSSVCWFRTWAQSKPALRWYFILSVAGMGLARFF